MSRRQFLLASLPLLVAPLPVRGLEDALPRIAYLSSRSVRTDAHLLAAFNRGLAEAGYVDGRNAHIDFRWADGHYDRLAALAAELAKGNPAVLVAVGGSASALAAKSVAQGIPVVFAVGGDPVALGIVPNLGRPGGSITGVTVYSAALEAKRFALIREIAPSAQSLGWLVNPTNPSASSELRDAKAAAGVLRLRLHPLEARNDVEIEAAFRAIAQLRADALAVASDGFLIGRRAKIVALANELRLPAIYAVREFVEAGGLVSYGTRFEDMYRQVGLYAGRVLKGAAPASLPVQQPTQYELVVNAKAAKALGIALPPVIMLRADHVIE